jgi:hypothetical protein
VGWIWTEVLWRGSVAVLMEGAGVSGSGSPCHAALPPAVWGCGSGCRAATAKVKAASTLAHLRSLTFASPACALIQPNTSLDALVADLLIASTRFLAPAGRPDSR